MTKKQTKKERVKKEKKEVLPNNVNKLLKDKDDNMLEIKVIGHLDFGVLIFFFGIDYECNQYVLGTLNPDNPDSDNIQAIDDDFYHVEMDCTEFSPFQYIATMMPLIENIMVGVMEA